MKASFLIQTFSIQTFSKRPISKVIGSPRRLAPRRLSVTYALLFAAAIVAGVTASNGCSASGKSSRSVTYDTVTTMSGLRYIDYQRGTGNKIEPGMTVSVDYAGYLADGTLFDTSLDSVGQMYDKQGKPLGNRSGAAGVRFDRGGYPFQPIEFVVGQGKVIRGWDEGLTTNMNVGGQRRLIIPPALGYGSGGYGTSIPPNSTLIFDIHPISAK